MEELNKVKIKSSAGCWSSLLVAVQGMKTPPQGGNGDTGVISFVIWPTSLRLLIWLTYLISLWFLHWTPLIVSSELSSRSFATYSALCYCSKFRDGLAYI